MFYRSRNVGYTVEIEILEKLISKNEQAEKFFLLYRQQFNSSFQPIRA
jgi:hypothetical protein